MGFFYYNKPQSQNTAEEYFNLQNFEMLFYF